MKRVVDNNRWRGIRRWENGDVWALQSHHLIRLLVPSHQPLSAGIEYATTAGVHVGSHEHTHFEFKIGCKDEGSPLPSDEDPASIAHPIDFDGQTAAAQAAPEVLHLDPWIVFWQIFEDRREEQGEVRDERPAETVLVDDRDPGFYATPYFWVGHRFSRVPRDRRGYAGFYLTNGGRSVDGESVRFTPDLRAGVYEVAFSEATPIPSGSEWEVLIRHGQGETTTRVRPEESRVLGTFAFDEGMDGYVQIQAGGSRGLVIADAVEWRPTDPPAAAD